MDKEKREAGDVAIELGDRPGNTFDAQTPGSRARSPAAGMPAAAGGAASATNNPVISILSYCGSSILMTVTNKYVLSGTGFNLNFFLLCVQVCSSAL